MLSAADVTNLMNGGLYVNVHSTLATGGEIRGQLMPAVVINEFSYDDSGTDDHEFVDPVLALDVWYRTSLSDDGRSLDTSRH